MMKRTVQMTKNHGPNWRAKPKFKGYRKVRVIIDGMSRWRPKP